MNQNFLDYVRALSKDDKKTLSQKALKTAEEVGELAKVVLPFDGAYATNHRMPQREKILEEACDTVLCALSVAYDLNFSDEEIDQMLQRKAEKWAVQQNKEKGFKFPIPFELHMTVHLDETESLDRFRVVCADIGVKPIILDLQATNGTSVMNDVMTSSKHFGTNGSVLDEMVRIRGALIDANFRCVRSKVETVPWHPAAPQYSEEPMPPNCYFESHIAARLKTDDELRIFRNMCERFELHVSQNVFKRYDDGAFVVMATKRDYNTFRGKFEIKVSAAVHALRQEGLNIEEPITEFAVYDTKVSHDYSWLKAT